jgi:isoleucyl-tRNA synthetase
VRLSRRRFWKGDYSADKISAYQTLYTCLEVVAQLIAPIAPFFADWLFTNLNRETNRVSSDSVHLTFFPKSQDAMRDAGLEQRMTYAQKISSLILSLRKKESLRVRQPLKRVLLPILDPSFQDQVEAVKDLILSEVNIKSIEFITDTSGLIKKRIKPNFKSLGKRLGSLMKEANGKIQMLTQDKISAFEEHGKYDLELDGKSFELSLEDVLITSEDIPGWQVASDGEIVVALDTSLDEQLLAEGTARELVNRIQNLRKQLEFNVTDRIVVQIEGHESVMPAVRDFGDYIMDEVLANDIRITSDTEGEQVELLDGVQIQIALSLAVGPN